MKHPPLLPAHRRPVPNAELPISPLPVRRVAPFGLNTNGVHCHRLQRGQIPSISQTLGSVAEATVFTHDRLQAVVREGVGGVAVPARHRLRRDERVEHRLRRRLDRRLKEIVDLRLEARIRQEGALLKVIRSSTTRRSTTSFRRRSRRRRRRCSTRSSRRRR